MLLHQVINTIIKKKGINQICFILFFCTISTVNAQYMCSNKDLKGDWQLYKIENLDGAKDSLIKNVSYFQLTFKSLNRVRGDIFNGISYGHYWGKYKKENNFLNIKTKVYYPDFIGKNGKDVIIYLSYLNRTKFCQIKQDTLIIHFEDSAHGFKSGKLYFKPIY